ncbi:mitochondrial processing peptidase [Babesia microti strain RI]|uniref:Mitochondrial processing peptidase n=1 Tax=Babesia microti (strain RI) TaxID=1133968 RepID=A0A1R4A9V9_BABMR|nr:mitochondrial processing peptidase [Babesia microti strain RI]SJK85783.1 mitochondrial processing peptidase [Babesia microti strain RI]|eukprot:XP_021338005.1 mitochondrial processing peptidase [Babesia microti strain RI]
MASKLCRALSIQKRNFFSKCSQVPLEKYMSNPKFLPQTWNQPTTEISTLDNGLRVASVKTQDETVTVGVWIYSGSRYETAETNGTAHFLEHMIFKGTEKRTRVQLERQIEAKGAHLNAYTAREQTGYYAKCFAKDTTWCIELLSDILQNSVIDPGQMETEKHVILREMEEVEKSKDEVIFDRLHMTAFRDSSLGFTILGPEENIRNMKRQHLIDYINANYTTDRMVLCAVGNVDHNKLVADANTYMSTLRRGDKKERTEVKPFFVGSELLNRNDDMGPTAHVAVAFEGVPWDSPDVIAFMLMQSIIGTYRKDEGIIPGKISGNRTIHAVANRMTVGCADMFTAFNTCYKDTGLFGFYAQCDEVAIDHCIGELMFGITSLSYSVTDEEVERAKKQLLTQFLGMMDSTSTLAEEVARQVLVYGRRIPLSEFIIRLQAIDSEEIKRVAWKYLHDQEIAVTALGPIHGIPPLHDIRQKTYWLRY